MFAFYGIISGAIYLAFCFLRRLFNFNVFVSIPLDILCGFVVGYMFYKCTILYAFGVSRLYLLIAFLLGLILVIVCLKNFVATISDFVYNYVRKFIIYLYNKIKSRRKTSERKKINKTC